MDENGVRELAQAHADAVVAGDLKKASSDLTEAAMGQAPGVMKALPRPTTSATIEALSTEGDEVVARIKYMGENNATQVTSRWAEQSGRPMITSLELS